MKATPFGNLFEFIRNGMSVSQDKSGNGLPITRIETIAAGEIDPSRVGYAGLEPEDCKQWLLAKGDILFSHINSAELVGKCAVYRGEPLRLVHGMNLLCLRPKTSEIDPNYALRLIRSAGFRARLSNFVNKAVNQASVSIANLRTIQVSVPPLEEQRRVAAILDKADALRQKRRATLQKLDSLTQSFFLYRFGDPATNPKRLPQIELGEIARFVGGGTPSREVEAYYGGSICWATSKDMKGEVLQDTQEHITEEAIKQSATKLVEPGAVLVVVKSKVLLHRLPVLINRVPTCFGQDLKAIVLPPQWPARYIARHLRIDQNRLLGQARGINTEGLTLEHLRRYKLLRPPCSDLSRYDYAEERIESQRNVSLKAIDLLNSQFASLQYRAFRGEL